MKTNELAKLFAEEARTNKSQRNIEDYFQLHLDIVKSEWERISYGQGWINGVNSIKKSKLNAPEP